MPWSKDAQLSPTRWLRLSLEEPDGDWLLRLLVRDGDELRVDPAPGLRFPLLDIIEFRDFMIRTLKEVGSSPARVELVDVAESYRDAAEAGDQTALVVVQVIRALVVALRDGDKEASEFLSAADAYLQRKFPRTMPLGAGDSRIKRPGRRPAAAERLLRIAEPMISTQDEPLEVALRARGAEDAFDGYAEELAQAIETLFPHLCPANRSDLKRRRTGELAETLRRMSTRTPEGIVRAALRTFEMPKTQARNFFSYQDRK